MWGKKKPTPGFAKSHRTFKRKASKFRELPFDIGTTDLAETYIHSNLNTFLNYMSKGMVQSYINEALSKASVSYESLKQETEKRRLEILALEKKYCEERFKGKDRNYVIKYLNDEYEKYSQNTETMVFNISNVKANMTAIQSAKRKKGAKLDLPSKEMALYFQQIQRVSESLSKIVYIYNQSKKPGYDSTYNEQIKSLENLLKEINSKIIDKVSYQDASKKIKTIEDLKNEDFLKESNRSIFTEMFSKISDISTSISVGWLREVGIHQFLDYALGESGERKVVGAQYSKAGFVADLLLGTLTSGKKVGVNIKSQKQKYSIDRVNKRSHLGFHTMTKGARYNYLYALRNSIALNQYYVEYSGDSSVKSGLAEVRRIYDLIYRTEKSMAAIGNLASIMDGIINEITEEHIKSFSLEVSPEHIYSILVSFQGGFLWTSDVLESLIVEMDNFTKQNFINNQKDSNSILSILFYDRSDISEKRRDMGKKLYSSKKAAIRKLKNDKVPVTYKAIHGSKEPPILKQMTSFIPVNNKNSLIQSVTYEINLENIKNRLNK